MSDILRKGARVLGDRDMKVGCEAKPKLLTSQEFIVVFALPQPSLNLYDHVSCQKWLSFLINTERREMQFTMACVILFTQHYEECVSFYGDTLELEMLHKIDRVGEQLTTFNLGNTYLMVETGGIANGNPKSLENSPIKFRFNVPNVKAACDALRSKGIAVTVFDHTWGMTAEFHDPDGNCCALRSDEGFGE